MEHKSETNVFHLILFCAVFLAAVHVTPMSCSSAKRECLHVSARRPILLLPWGSHSSAAFLMFPPSFLSVWPIHFHALLFKSISTGSCLSCCQRSSYLIVSGHLIPRILLRQLFTNTWSLFRKVFFYDTATKIRLKPPTFGLNNVLTTRPPYILEFSIMWNF